MTFWILIWNITQVTFGVTSSLHTWWLNDGKLINVRANPWLRAGDSSYIQTLLISRLRNLKANDLIDPLNGKWNSVFIHEIFHDTDAQRLMICHYVCKMLRIRSFGSLARMTTSLWNQPITTSWKIWLIMLIFMRMVIGTQYGSWMFLKKWSYYFGELQEVVSQQECVCHLGELFVQYLFLLWKPCWNGLTHIHCICNYLHFWWFIVDLKKKQQLLLLKVFYEKKYYLIFL